MFTPSDRSSERPDFIFFMFIRQRPHAAEETWPVRRPGKGAAVLNIQRSLRLSSPHIAMQPNHYAHALPVDWENPHQSKLYLNPSDKEAFQRLAPRQSDTFIRARDGITGKWFAIRRFPCWRDSNDCYCAAQDMEIKGPRAKVEFPILQSEAERSAEWEEERLEDEREQREREEDEEGRLEEEIEEEI